MFKRWLYLQAPEDGSGSGSGGSAIAAQLFNEHRQQQNNTGGRSGVSDNPDEGSDSGESGEDDSDSDDSDDSGDAPRKRSWIAENLEKLEREEADAAKSKKDKSKKDKPEAEDGGDEEDTEDEGDDEEASSKEKEKKAKPVEWDGKRKLTDEELLNLEPKGKGGNPLTAQPAAAFNAIKSRLREMGEELKTLKSPEAFKVHTDRIAELQAQLTEKETKITELAQQIDDEFFENSPGFKETFQKPVDESLETLKEFFDHVDPKADEEDFKAINGLFSKANLMAYRGKKKEYLQVMSELCDTYVEGGTLSKNAFGEACLAYFKAQKGLAEAKVSKDSTRKTMVENRMAEMREKSYATTEAEVNRFLKGFEADNHPFIESLDPDTKKKFKESYTGKHGVVKQALAQFAASGKLPPTLDKIIAAGIAFEAMEQKSVMGWGAFVDTYRKSQQLQDKIKTLEKKLAKYTKEPEVTSSKGSRTSDDSGERRGKTKSAIANALAAQGVNLDDD